MYRYREYICQHCGHYKEELFKRDDFPLVLDCEVCGEEEGMKLKTVSMPAPMRASWPDGYSRGGDYELIKEASKLNVEAASKPANEAAEIKREATKLQKRATKEYSKVKSNKE